MVSKGRQSARQRQNLLEVVLSALDGVRSTDELAVALVGVAAEVNGQPVRLDARLARDQVGALARAGWLAAVTRWAVPAAAAA